MKRAMDFAMAALLLLMLAPVFVILSVLIGVQFGFPVVLKISRLGIHGRPFYLFQYRTVYRKQNGALKPQAVSASRRRTAEFIHHSGWDKLPQLLNVLRGEMSLVGPSPRSSEYLSRCNMEQARRFHVRPGITGWAQINGRSGDSWVEKNRLDIWYVDHRSLQLDFWILWVALKSAIGRNKISNIGIPRYDSYFGPGWKDG